MIKQPILIDIFEPSENLAALSQVTTTIRASLNTQDKADYYWAACDWHTIQIERKQCAELLGDMDAVEAVLNKYIPSADELCLLVEGVMCPSQFGVDTYVQSPGKPYYRLAHRFGTEKKPQLGLYSKYQSWRWSLDKAGITVYETSCMEGTQKAIAAFYNNSQQSEHTTLKRYLRQKPTQFNANPHVRALMGLSLVYGLGIGEEKAVMLIDKFKSLAMCMLASVDELCQIDGIGKNTARKLREAWIQETML